MYKNIYNSVTDSYLSNLYCDSEGQYKRIEYQKCNYILKLNGNKVDLMYFPEGFVTPIHSVENEICQDYKVDYEVERFFKRNFEREKTTNFAKRKEDSEATISDLQKSINLGNKRAIKNFYDYAFANDWEYFCTFTFENPLIRQNNDLLYLSWENFRKQLRRGNPDVKSLAVYEEFKKGGYHIHALVSNCDLKLLPARNTHTGKFKFNDFGVQIFNSLDWKIGYTDIACINPNSCNERVVNYMSKYMTKNCVAPPGCKRYFKTNNLESRQTLCLYSDNITEVIDTLGLLEFKTTDKCNFYSNYSNLCKKI